VWPWQRNRDSRSRSAGTGVIAPDLSSAPGEGTFPATSPMTASSPFDDPAFVAGLRPIPSKAAEVSGKSDPWPATDIVGVHSAGDELTIRIDSAEGRLLLVFLSTHCDGCETFWSQLGNPEGAGLPDDVSAVIITKGPNAVPPDEVAAASEGIGTVPVVMSDSAWTSYRVMGYPFLVLVDVASRSVVGEAVGMSWDDVVDIVGSPT